ncbi:hypothetical protein EZS27_030351 [termite gut metagenome]|uniref:Uncharacterized protein n=1 Tax=termite gut metagenome TaxID=433724 RepID=A0A5J4QDU5_9ZZZZ
MERLTEVEIYEIAARVESLIRVNSKGVGELPVVNSLSNILSFPTLRLNGGIPEAVLAPIALLQQIAIDSIAAAIAAANTATGNATTAINSINTSLALALAATNAANQAAALALARLQELDGFTEMVAQDLSLSPTRMELTYVQKITLRNPYVQYITAKLFPAYLPQNVLFLPESGDSLQVDPVNGKLAVVKTGKSYFHVIPIGNTSLRQTITIEVTAPVCRKTGTGGIRLTSGGAIRIT